MLPEAYDYNLDEFTIEFNPSTWNPWAHVLDFDGQSKLTVMPESLTVTDL